MNNPLDARESEETYEYPARPYTLPMRPVQTFRALSESGDVPTAQATEFQFPKTDAEWEEFDRARDEEYQMHLDITGLHFNAVEDWETDGNPFSEEAWEDKYLTAEDARVLRQDGI